MLRFLFVYCGTSLIVFYGLIYLVERLFPINMKGKAILITGCDTGFGHDFAIRCVQNGMIVFAGCHLPETLRILESKSLRLPGRISTFLLDVGSQESIDRAHKLVKKNLPTGHGLHAVLNNAGIVKVGFDDWITAADYEECLKINTLGTIQISEKFKDLVKREKGRIVLVSSIAGRMAIPGFGPYNVSKFAIEGYADTIRLELHPFGVKVAIIEPGFHRTAITSPQYWVQLFGKAWDTAPESVQAEYGGKNFLKRYNVLLSMLLNSPLNSTRVNRVVDAYYDSVSAVFPRKRYLVGKAAKFFFVPLSMLPACMTDFILRFILYILRLATLEEFEAADTPVVHDGSRPNSPPGGAYSVASFPSASTTSTAKQSSSTSTAKN